MGEIGGDLAVGGVEGLVLGLLLEPRPVVGVDDVARQVPEAHAQDVVVAHGPLDEAVEGRGLGRAQALAEGAAVEDGLDGGLGHEGGFGAPFGDASRRRLVAVAAHDGAGRPILLADHRRRCAVSVGIGKRREPLEIRKSDRHHLDFAGPVAPEGSQKLDGAEAHGREQRRFTFH